MTKKIKPANLVFYDKNILFECPYCGMNLIKTDYIKIRRLLEDTGDTPRGKVCDNCGGTVMLKLSSKAREIIKARSPGGELAESDRTIRIES